MVWSSILSSSAHSQRCGLRRKSMSDLTSKVFLDRVRVTSFSQNRAWAKAHALWSSRQICEWLCWCRCHAAYLPRGTDSACSGHLSPSVPEVTLDAAHYTIISHGRLFDVPGCSERFSFPIQNKFLLLSTPLSLLSV